MKSVAQKALVGAALASVMVAGTAANAGIITQYGYDSIAPGPNSGKDAFNNPWTWNKTLGPKSKTSPGKGYSAWGTPGLGDGVVKYEGSNPSDDFAVSFDYFVNAAIDQAAATSGGGYQETTRLSVDGVLWIPTYNGTDSVVFDAPAGDWITKGETYFVNIVFDGKQGNLLNGKTAGFSATWSATVPEASTWAMLGIGFAGIGLVGRTRRRKGSRYAL